MRNDICIDDHAYDGMHAEKPPIKLEHLYETRSIIVYYDEYEVDIYVRSISATRRKIV